MATLKISTTAQKRALVAAIDHMNEVLRDQLDETLEQISDVHNDPDCSLFTVRELRKKLQFVEAFTSALSNSPDVIVQGGMGIYLEGLETEVVREALELLADIEGEPTDPTDVLTTEAVKQAMLSTSTSWGATDPERLAAELRELVSEAVSGDRAANELLDSLN